MVLPGRPGGRVARRWDPLRDARLQEWSRLCASGIALESASAAPPDAVWLGGTGLWSDASQWTSDPRVPGSPDFREADVEIGSGSVTLDFNPSLGELALRGGAIEAGPFRPIMRDLFTWSGGTLTGTGAAEVRNGMAIEGEVSLGGGYTLELDDSFATQRGGDLRFGAGGSTLRIDSGSTYSLLDDSGMSPGGGTGTLINFGTLQKTGGTGVSTIDAFLLRSQVVSVSAGTLRFAGNVTEVFEDNTLQSGKDWNVLDGSAVEFSQASASGGRVIEVNRARVVLSGGSARIADASGNDVMQGFLRFNGGLLTLQHGANFLTAPTGFTNGGGRLTVGADTTFTVGGSNDYFNGGGRTTLASGTSILALAPGQSFSNDAFRLSELEGFGTIEGDVDNAAMLRPGLPEEPGLLTITGDYAEDAASPYTTLSILLGGSTAGIDFSRLEVLGTSSLAGMLEIERIDDFTPSVGDEFVILTSAAVSGSFANDTVELGDLAFEILYEPDQVVLRTTAIPEPTTILLLGAGLALMALPGRRRGAGHGNGAGRSRKGDRR